MEEIYIPIWEYVKRFLSQFWCRRKPFELRSKDSRGRLSPHKTIPGFRGLLEELGLCFYGLGEGGAFGVAGLQQISGIDVFHSRIDPQVVGGHASCTADVTAFGSWSGSNRFRESRGWDFSIVPRFRQRRTDFRREPQNSRAVASFRSCATPRNRLRKRGSFNASRKAGMMAADSERALIMWAAPDASLAQKGYGWRIQLNNSLSQSEGNRRVRPLRIDCASAIFCKCAFWHTSLFHGGKMPVSPLPAEAVSIHQPK